MFLIAKVVEIKSNGNRFSRLRIANPNSAGKNGNPKVGSPYLVAESGDFFPVFPFPNLKEILTTTLREANYDPNTVEIRFVG